MRKAGAKEQYEEARWLYAEGRFKDAIEILDRLQETFPESADISQARQMCLTALERSKPPVAELRPRRRWARYAILTLVIAVFAAPLFFAALKKSTPRSADQIESSQPQTEATPEEEETDPVLAAVEKGADAPPELIPESVKCADVPKLITMMRNDTLFIPAYAELTRRATLFDIKYLHPALKGPVHRVRYSVAILLGKIGSTASIKPLLAMLEKDRSRWERREAALSLGRIGGELVIEPLNKAMCSDPDVSVRKFAAHGLYLALGEQAIPYFQSALAIETFDGCRLNLRWLCDTNFKGTTPPAITPGKVAYGSYYGMLYKLYTPKNYDPNRPCRLLVSVHGSDGSPEAYADMCRATADREYCFVLAPYFDACNFPIFDMLSEDITGTRSDQRLLQAVDNLPQYVNVQTDRFFLFGHSKGGQFVLRFVMGHPERILRAAACGFGIAIMPDDKSYFPYGVRPNPLLPDLPTISFDNMVKTEMAVVVGTKDPRMKLAKEFTAKAKEYAEKHGIGTGPELFIVNNGPHAGVSNFPTAAEFLFAN